MQLLFINSAWTVAVVPWNKCCSREKKNAGNIDATHIQTNTKDEKCFYPKFFFGVCKTMCFYLKWCMKIKIQQKMQKINLRKLYVKQWTFAQQSWVIKPKKFLETQ